MLTKDELLKQPEYWLEMLQNEIYRQVAHYIDDKNINQTQFAQELGVTRGYVSQIMKGEFNYTLKKFIELSLAVGKAPVIEFKPIQEFIEKNTRQAEFQYKNVTEFKTGAGRFTILNNGEVVEYNASQQSNMRVLQPIAA